MVEEKVSNSNIEENSDYDEFINKINGFRKKDKNIKIVIIILFIILSIVMANPLIIILGFIVLGIYITYRNWEMLIPVEYDFDDENEKYFETMNNFFEEIASSKKLWLIESKYKNFDTKFNAGIDNSIFRIPISIKERIPYYLKTNIKCYCLNIKDKQFYFLHNNVLIHDKNKTIGINFKELSFDFNETVFVEQQIIPSDCKVMGYTYQYVKKDGKPDKRYKNNPKYPKCVYGTIDIKNDNGLNLSILLSSKYKTMQAKQLYETLKDIDTIQIKKCINCGENISLDANYCKYCGTKQ